MQRLAFFDLDGTLLDRDAAFGAWVDEFVTDHGLSGTARAWLIHADALHIGPMDGFFHRVREEFAFGTPADDLWAQYRRRMPELVEGRPDDLAALGELRASGWKTAIVTNGMTDNQQAKIRRSGLSELVDAWCISDEVGLRKPDPGIFRLAAQLCGMPSEQGGWMIGDSVIADIAGGRTAGLRTIWIRRARSWPQTETRPDHEADNVAGAVKILLSRQA
ncbi:HAD family hydrolase [Kitasatospora mediocidica]|uniref:HAD family hydrolase n=1 Tax=Kitasatospora mediocidica TaxID=58352 RepID=UPI00055FEDF6|nr:HAD family hydrolase [Kitasatospora mediocidica]